MKILSGKKAVLGFMATAGLVAFSSSCTHVGNSWLPGTMATASNNQIMLVRAEPPSFGYQRLSSQSDYYPDLALFVSKRGLPNFLAETRNKDRHYFILYYLGDREAYACRSPSARSHAVEFAGPYPITDREFKMLDGFRKDPTRVPVKF